MPIVHISSSAMRMMISIPKQVDNYPLMMTFNNFFINSANNNNGMQSMDEIVRPIPLHQQSPGDNLGNSNSFMTLPSSNNNKYFGGN